MCRCMTPQCTVNNTTALGQTYLNSSVACSLDRSACLCLSQRQRLLLSRQCLHHACCLDAAAAGAVAATCCGCGGAYVPAIAVQQQCPTTAHLHKTRTGSRSRVTCIHTVCSDVALPCNARPPQAVAYKWATRTIASGAHHAAQ
jgi:hypothetical protein